MVLEPIIDTLVALKSELLIFCLAILVHALFYGNILPRKPISKKAHGPPSKASGFASKPQMGARACGDTGRPIRRRSDGTEECDASFRLRNTKSNQDTGLDIERAHGIGDVRAVLRSWNGVRNKNVELEPQHLVMVVQSMQRLRIDSDSIARGIQGYLKCNASALGNMNYINEIIESVAKSLDSSLIDELLLGLEELSLESDSKTFEILIQMHFTTRSFKEIEALHQRMEAQGVAPTSRTSLVLVKMALHGKNITAAMRHHKSFAGMSATPMPAHVEVQLVELASRELCLGAILAELESGAMSCSVEVLNALLSQCATCDRKTAERIFRMACQQALEKNGTTYELLLRMANGDVETIRQICEDLLSLGRADYVRDVASQLLAALEPSTDVALADKLLELAREDSRTHSPTFSSLVCFYAEAGENDKACDIYVQHLRPQPSESITRSLMDAKTQRCLVNAALSCRNLEIVEEFLNVSSPHARAKCVDVVRARVAKGDVELPDHLIEAVTNGNQGCRT